MRTDKTFLGEAFLHKLIGIFILLIAMRLLTITAQEIGFTKNNILKRTFQGLILGTAVFLVAYSVEIFISVMQGKFQSLELYVSSYAVDGNIGNQTGISFFLICIAGNIINVVMEEGIFRGLFQTILEKKYNFILSAVIASILFGLWHLIGPVRNYYDGISSFEGMVINISMLVITSALVGFKFALLTKITGSLYMAMGDHFVNNTMVNILHVVSNKGADELMFLRITIAQIISFAIVLIYYLKCRRTKAEQCHG
ncbi:MAG: CPBP family intramembrane glutamic endopeptidase [Anaerovorax sp.]|nr:CPBP family intramembrane glutamic endopeptidase [Anaerovorax sp.]